VRSQAFIGCTNDLGRSNSSPDQPSSSPSQTCRTRAVEQPPTGGAELPQVAGKTGDDAVLVGNGLLAQQHDIRRASNMSPLRLGQRGERGGDRQDECECYRLSHGEEIPDPFLHEGDSRFHDVMQV
jgi:hypothetical protein